MSSTEQKLEALQKRHEQLTASVQNLLNTVTAHTFILRESSLQEEPAEIMRRLDRVAELYKDPDWEHIRPIAAFVLGIPKH